MSTVRAALYPIGGLVQSDHQTTNALVSNSQVANHLSVESANIDQTTSVGKSTGYSGTGVISAGANVNFSGQVYGTVSGNTCTLNMSSAVVSVAGAACGTLDSKFIPASAVQLSGVAVNTSLQAFAFVATISTSGVVTVSPAAANGQTLVLSGTYSLASSG